MAIMSFLQREENTYKTETSLGMNFGGSHMAFLVENSFCNKIKISVT